MPHGFVTGTHKEPTGTLRPSRGYTHGFWDCDSTSEGFDKVMRRMQWGIKQPGECQRRIYATNLHGSMFDRYVVSSTEPGAFDL